MICAAETPSMVVALRTLPATTRSQPQPQTPTPARPRQEDIIHEAQTMKSYHHPNVLSLYASFVAGQDLYMITPFMSGGSVLHIMKYGHPEVRMHACTRARAGGSRAFDRAFDRRRLRLRSRGVGGRTVSWLDRCESGSMLVAAVQGRP